MNDDLSEVVGHYQKGMHFGEVTITYIVPFDINHFETASVVDAIGVRLCFPVSGVSMCFLVFPCPYLVFLSSLVH